MNRIASLLLRSVGLNRPQPRSRIGRWARRVERVAVALVVPYVALHCYPQALFAHTVTAHDITVYSRQPLSPQTIARLAEARALVNQSELAIPRRAERVFVCNSPWLYRFFAPLQSSSFAISLPGTDNIFIAAADIDTDDTSSSLGGHRSLSGVIAHEITHGLIRHRLGLWRPMLLPEWVVEGYCDTIARSGSFPEAEGRRLLATGRGDASPSFRYLLHRQMVTYLIDDRHLSFAQVVARAGAGATVEAELRQAFAAQR